jgi:hypothetical protein
MISYSVNKNYQWQITNYGLETRANNDEYFTEYSIAAVNLCDLIEFEEICIFREMLHLLGREWVIGENLLEIYPFALKFHKQKFNNIPDDEKIKKAMMFFKSNDTYLKAREIKEKLAKCHDQIQKY